MGFATLIFGVFLTAVPCLRAGAGAIAELESLAPGSIYTPAARPAPDPAGAGIYLDTEEFASPAQTKLLETASGKIKPSFAEAKAWLDEYSGSEQHKKIIRQYSERLYDRLGVGPKESVRFKRKYPTLYKGILAYAGDSSPDSTDDGFRSLEINDKLRRNTPLTTDDEKFIAEVVYSISHLPAVRGLAFRGRRMYKTVFDSIPYGDWPQPAFTSTSISYEAAVSFGNPMAAGMRTGVIVLKIKGGAPFSPLTFDKGTSDLPGRFFEYEALLPPGRTLFVTHKLEDAASDLYLVFAEER